MVFATELEESACLDEEAFAEEGATDLQHQFVIVGEVEVDQALECAQRALELAEHEERLAEPGEGVFVIGVEDDRGIERLTCPRVFLACQLGIADTDVKLDGLWIAGQPVPEEGECSVVTCFVVELVGLFVVVIRAAKRLRHGRNASRKDAQYKRS